MNILGIDPGSLFCGYGLIEAPHAQPGKSCLGQLQYRSSGRIAMAASKPLHERLRELFTSLREVIGEYRPDEIVIERMFFAKNTKAALSLGHTRGVVLLAASMAHLPIHEYTALQVKQAVAGYGRADKNQVQQMVRRILGIRHELSADSADALALALCHANMQGPLTTLRLEQKPKRRARV